MMSCPESSSAFSTASASGPHQQRLPQSVAGAWLTASIILSKLVPSQKLKQCTFLDEQGYPLTCCL
eukprot:356133-Chlamydomonas_euryale.AAC.1